jgi:hypothetical protein
MATDTPLLVTDPECGSRRLYADPSPRNEMQDKENDANDQKDVE